ncbi:MAG: site-specific integrase, partial [Candidatus Omnitrophica bacterium]|nr:site-specific integrase [Candidatus Omnitrophota bacterium]
MKAHIENFLYFLEVERGVSHNTIVSYKKDLEKFIGYLDKRGITLTAVRREDIISFLMQLKDQGLSSGTVSRNLASLKTFWKFLTTEQVVKENPASIIETPKTWKTIPEILNKDEVEKLLNAPPDHGWIGIRDRSILELMYASGLRVSEVKDLKKSSVNMEVGF